MVAVIFFFVVQTVLLRDPAAFSNLFVSPFIFLLPESVVWICFGAAAMILGRGFFLSQSLREIPHFTPIGLKIVICAEAAAIRLLDRCWLSQCLRVQRTAVVIKGLDINLL